MAMKRIMFGVMWALAFSMVAAIVTGFAVALWMRADDPRYTDKDVSKMVVATLERVWPYVMGAAIALAVFGTGTGLLPGTRAAAKDEWVETPPSDSAAMLYLSKHSVELPPLSAVQDK